MLIIPLKVPHPFDLEEPLAEWVDRHMDFSSEECRQDLLRLASLRRSIVVTMSHPNGHVAAMNAIDDCHEYHASLFECESRGLTGGEEEPALLRLKWNGAFVDEPDCHETLMWERACVLWNMVAIESYLASKQASDSPASLKTQVAHWKMAASQLKKLKEHVQEHNLEKTSVDFSMAMLEFWENAAMAQGQMATYKYSLVGRGRKPAHALLAKVAAGTQPLLNRALKLSQDAALSSRLPDQTPQFGVYCKSMIMWYKAKAEFHDSCACHSKNQYGMEIARLKRALSITVECHNFLQSLSQLPSSLDGFEHEVLEERSTLHERLEDAESDNHQIYHEVVPTGNVRDIIGQVMIKQNSEMPHTMWSPSVPLFRQLLGDGAQKIVQEHSRDMESLFLQMSSLVGQETDRAKTALSEHNLPQALALYHRELAGGGIPQDLWNRVDQVQKEERLKKLKTDLWHLRDIADSARDTAGQIKKQLDEDVDMDRLFREEYPGFTGHDASEMQEEARSTLKDYERLLTQSQDGDSVLMKKMEVLDSDAKYQLLKFPKSKLDNLVPTTATAGPPIDTRRLSESLSKLSKLLDEREIMLKELKESVQSQQVRTKLSNIAADSPAADEQYQEVINEARAIAQQTSGSIQANVAEQEDLLRTVVEENERFTAERSRMGRPTNSGRSCIVMIDDAIEDIEFFSKHLKEGHNFYSVVTPKLEQLKSQVSDISVRLTVERCDYQDAQNGDNRRKDEFRQQNLANNDGGYNRDTGAPGPSRVAQGTYTAPEVRVDDAMVANLVSMGFDPDKVVTALKKHDNNTDQALNELLLS